MFKLFSALLFSLYLITPANAAHTVQCAYPNLDREQTNNKNCGVINSQGYFIVHQKLRAKIDWSIYGMACFYVHGNPDVTAGWYYIGQEGKGLPASYGWDNDCTAFSQGLARGKVFGKVVFYNRMFKIVLNTDYVWASAFVDGFAKVCKGNLERYHPLINGKPDEHHDFKKGQCGYIDLTGKIIQPLTTPYEKLDSPAVIQLKKERAANKDKPRRREQN